MQRALGPDQVPVSKLANDTGVHINTIYRWIREASLNEGAMPSKPRPQVKAPATSPTSSAHQPIATSARRPEDWPALERLRVVAESAALSGDALGAFLRREGLHEETLAEWRAAALGGLAPQKPTRAEEKRIRQLERDLAKKEKALAEAAALLFLEKKVAKMLAGEDDDSSPKTGNGS